MKTGTKITVGILSAIALGTALYFFVFKKKTTVVATEDGTGTPPAKDVMIEKIKSLMYSDTDSQAVKDNLQSALEKMSDSELSDTYFTSLAYRDNVELSDGLKTRIADISKKYNIFT